MNKINVRSDESTKAAGPLVRKLLSAEVVTRKGSRWLMWKWVPEPKADGLPDCGYAGVREDHEEFSEMKTRLAKATGGAL